MFCYRDESEQKPDTKMDTDLQKAVKNIETTKSEVKSEIDETKSDSSEVKQDAAPTPGVTQMFSDGVQRLITPNQQMALQVFLP